MGKTDQEEVDPRNMKLQEMPEMTLTTKSRKGAMSGLFPFLVFRQLYLRRLKTQDL